MLAAMAQLHAQDTAAIQDAAIHDVGQTKQQRPILRVGRALKPQQARRELNQFKKSYSDLAGWEKRNGAEFRCHPPLYTISRIRYS